MSAAAGIDAAIVPAPPSDELMAAGSASASRGVPARFDEIVAKAACKHPAYNLKPEAGAKGCAWCSLPGKSCLTCQFSMDQASNCGGCNKVFGCTECVKNSQEKFQADRVECEQSQDHDFQCVGDAPGFPGTVPVQFSCCADAHSVPCQKGETEPKYWWFCSRCNAMIYSECMPQPTSPQEPGAPAAKRPRVGPRQEGALGPHGARPLIPSVMPSGGTLLYTARMVSGATGTEWVPAEDLARIRDKKLLLDAHTNHFIMLENKRSEPVSCELLVEVNRRKSTLQRRECTVLAKSWDAFGTKEVRLGPNESALFVVHFIPDVYWNPQKVTREHKELWMLSVAYSTDGSSRNVSKLKNVSIVPRRKGTQAKRTKLANAAAAGSATTSAPRT
jgi:hypothetical protein